jgi:hypothetical protein
MNMTDVSYKVDTIVNDLFLSLDRSQVESVFKRHEVDDPQERVNLLRKCMKVIHISNTTDELTIEDEYNDEIEIFVNASWRFLI